MDDRYTYRQWYFWEPYLVAIISTIVLYFSWFRFDEGFSAISVSLTNINQYMNDNLYILKFFTNNIEIIGYMLMAAVYIITFIEIIYIILKIFKVGKAAKVVGFTAGALNMILSMSILIRYFILIEFEGFIGMGIYIRLTFFPIFTFVMSCWQLLLSLPKPKWA